MGNKGEPGVSAPTLPATGGTGRRWRRLPVTGGRRNRAANLCGSFRGTLEAISQER